MVPPPAASGVRPPQPGEPFFPDDVAHELAQNKPDWNATTIGALTQAWELLIREDPTPHTGSEVFWWMFSMKTAVQELRVLASNRWMDRHMGIVRTWRMLRLEQFRKALRDHVDVAVALYRLTAKDYVTLADAIQWDDVAECVT